MFVLRSHELDPASAQRAEDPRVPANTDAGGRDWRRRESFRPAGRAAEGGPRPAPEPGAETQGHVEPQPGLPMPLPPFAAAFAVRFGGATAAAECPRRLSEVQTLIDGIGAGVDRARDRMPWEQMALVHALLDDSRMLLEAARQNHEQPEGPYDHARAVAKADMALGHARAAQALYARATRA